MSQTIAPVLGEATVQELREAVRGEILTPGDDGYAEACRVWNGAHDGRRPALVVRCTGAADVIAAVGFARSNDLPIAVRGGGHSIAGFSTCDDGIVIDLSPMNERPRRPRRAPRDGRRRRGLGRRRPRDAGARARDDRRPRLVHRRRRLHARRRHRLADAQVRPRVRQPRRRRRRHRRRPARPRERDRERRPALGPARRRRQLRHRHAVRVRSCTRSGRWSTPGRSSTRPTPTATCCARSATGRTTPRTRSPALVNLTTAPPLPVIPEEWHGKKVAAFIAVSAGPLDEGEALVRAFRDGRRADRRPARPDAVPRDPDADRPAVGEGHPRLLQGDEPRAPRRRADRPALRAPPRGARARSARSTCTRWAARSAASPTARRRSPSGRCRSCSTPSRAGTTRPTARRTRSGRAP